MDKIRNSIQSIHLTRTVGAFLLIIAVLSGVFGYINQYSKFYIPKPLVADFYANISTELASIALTVLIIDFLNERRAIQQEKAALILQMGSPINSAAREAIRQLRAKGWLTDGSLKNANLSWANLQDAYLSGAKMPGANLHRANLMGSHMQKSDLRGANIEDVQLAQARYLAKSILPNGNRYDGRFNLTGDLAWLSYQHNINSDDKKGMADFYLVSVEVYEQGQEWAKQNLSQLTTTANSSTASESSNNGNFILQSNIVNKFMLVAFGLLTGLILTKRSRNNKPHPS